MMGIEIYDIIFIDSFNLCPKSGKSVSGRNINRSSSIYLKYVNFLGKIFFERTGFKKL